jgi:RimJ/RimL family protein N-acetyltransferase
MAEREETGSPARQHHEQMLKLVAKGFFNELVNYGVNEAEVLKVAGHLLDNVLHKSGPSNKTIEFYNKLFTIRDVKDEWAAAKRLSVNGLSIAPMEAKTIPQVVAWLRDPAVRDNFYPKYPEKEAELKEYFSSPMREYFSIWHEGTLAGIMGADHIDAESGRVEMRKLVGETAMRGKGIGKRATLLFLYYVFVVKKFRKVYLHSLDINIRNLNLNGKFGFELEGVFLEEVMVGGKMRDVVRMALAGPIWLELFA